MTGKAPSDSSPHPGQLATISELEDFGAMALTPGQIEGLVGDRGQCILTWTTQDGFPMGVPMAYLHRDGRFWTNCAEQRKRVSALRARPKSAIIIADNTAMVTFKGTSTIHTPNDEDWKPTKARFYAALAGTEENPQDPTARAFEQFLDGPRQVIIETSPTLVVSFDFSRFMAATQAAIAANASPRL